MKKIFLLWICLALVSMLCTSVVFAEETDASPDVVTDDVVDEAPTESPAESISPITEEQIQEVGETMYKTLFNRVFEFVEFHKDTIIMVLGFIGTAFITLRDIHRKKIFDVSFDSKQSSILSGLEGVTSSQNGVVDVINALIVGYEEMKKKYIEYEGVEDDRNRIIGSVMVQNAAILDILSSVYANSSVLPQGVKDLVYLKYARCQTALDDDERLKECVLAVHEIINGKQETPAETEVA